MKRFFSGSGDHAVSGLEEELLGVGADGLSSIGVGGEGSVLDHEGLDLLDVETGGVVNGGVVLNDSGDLTTILLDELGGPVADGTETLDDEGLVLDSEVEVATIDKGLGVEELTDGVVDTETSRFGSSGNTTLGDEFTSATSFGVDIGLTLDVHVGVLDPGHDLLVGSHVGSEAINLGTDKALLDELHGVLTGDSLDLVLRVLSGVNLDSTFSSTEGNISDGKLEGHQGSESLDLLKIDVIGVTSATFDGELVSGVLGSVAGDGLEGAIISTEWDVESYDSLASLNEVEVLLTDASLLSGFVVEKLDLLEETRLTELVELGSELGGGGELGSSHGALGNSALGEDVR